MIKKTVKARLYEKIEIDDNGCWLFTGHLDDCGYGRMQEGSAHRVSYQLHVGPIPAKLEIDHICHDPAVCQLRNECPHRRCVNPDHLRLTTHQENTQPHRAVSTQPIAAKSKRDAKYCKRGHERTSENLWTSPKTGGRTCRICMQAYMKEYRERKERERQEALEAASRKEAA